MYKLFYLQNNKHNFWYFYFGDYFSEEQKSRAFATENEAEKYAEKNGIKYDKKRHYSIFT